MSVNGEGGRRIRRAAVKWVTPISVLIAYVALVFLVGLFVRSTAGIPFADYVKLVVPQSVASLGPLAAVGLLYFRWKADHDAREEQHRQQLEASEKRHHEQEIGKRQEKMGDRMAQAISHLGEGRGFMQVSGLIELSGLLDDWWRIGKEMNDLVPGGHDLDIDAMVRTRRQELVDLIFKHSLEPDRDRRGDDETEEKRKKMVQEAREQILRSRLPTTCAESDDDAESLRHLNLDRAHLKGADLKGAYLVGAHLEDAHLTGSRMRRTDKEKLESTGLDLSGVIIVDEEDEGNFWKKGYWIPCEGTLL